MTDLDQCLNQVSRKISRVDTSFEEIGDVVELVGMYAEQSLEMLAIQEGWVEVDDLSRHFQRCLVCSHERINNRMHYSTVFVPVAKRTKRTFVTNLVETSGCQHFNLPFSEKLDDA